MNKTALYFSWRTRIVRTGRLTLAALMALVLTAPPAAAQLSRIGDNPALGAAPARGTDTAYDPVNNIYLVVGGTAGNDVTPLYGVFVNAAGSPLAAPFQINTPGEQAYFPRVTYSPHINGSGGFMVTWHGGVPPTLRARAVAYPNGPIGSIGSITSVSDHQEASPGVAYSRVSQVFLVAWQTSNFLVYGAIFNLNAQVVAGPFQISNSDGGARDPSATWNSQTNEFGVLYTGWGSGGAMTTFARVNTSGTVLRNNRFNFTSGTFITDITYNPNTGNYVGAWFQGGTYGAEINANGDIVATGLLSTATGTRDGLGVAFNPISGTILMAGMGPSFNIWAAELNSRGARTGADTEVTFAGGPLGSYHPRTAASTNAADWNISYMHNFGQIRDQVVRTSTRGGGPAGSLGAPPPTGGGGGGGTTGGCTTASPGTGWTCVNGGWLPPSGGGGGGTTPGGCTTASPGTGWTCVNGGWVPPTSGGTSGGGSGCSTPDPFAAIGGGTCVNGGWIPGGSGGGGGSSGGTGCSTASPGTGWTCVNGGWLPPGSGGGSTGGSSCSTASPGSGWICVNGGWLPPGSGGDTTVGGPTCSTASPGSGWTCVNGGWLPPGMGGGGSTSGGSTCSTGSPGSGWVCVNGGWLPPGSGGGSTGGSTCSTASPGTGWTCVNGGWLPPGMGGGSSSGGCTTSDPFAAIGGGTCINGGWTFGQTSSSSSSCSTPDPFTAMGGGICMNGGWVPKG